MDNKIVEEVFEFDQFFHDQETKGNILKKNSKISEQTRKYGNQLYSKKKHDQNVHKNILFQYSKSIVFAPTDSEEQALGFSNRSVLLMHLRYYENCLIDIHKALEITKSVQLKSKLESRQIKCMLLLNNFKVKSLEEVTNNPNLDEDKPAISTTYIKPSTKLLSAAESVILKYNKTYGRHLIANRNIKPGEIIIAEKGYACYPEYNQIYLVCSHCLTFAWNGIPCDFCVFAIYCNETCKNEAWEEYHSIECPLLKFLHFNDNAHTIDVILATRIFIKAVKAEGFDNVMNETNLVHCDDGISRLLSNGVLKSNKFRSCYNLHCRFLNERINTNDHIYEDMIIFLLIKHTNIFNTEGEGYFYDKSDQKILMKLKNVFIKLRDIIKISGFHYQWCKCTCREVSECQEKCDTIRGLFIAPCSSLINHSCMPNISKFFTQQRKIVFYASKPIKKGEQLCCSYGPTVTMDHVSRQNYILQNFHFTCVCTACKKNKTIKYGFNTDDDMGTVLKIFTEFTKIYKDGAISPFFKESPDKWTVFNKKLLEQALTISDLTYHHFENHAAFAHSIPYMVYISHAFYNSYGEKCVMPDSC